MASGLRSRKGGDAQKGDLKGKFLQVVVPTYNETENIRPLCERLFKVIVSVA